MIGIVEWSIRHYQPGTCWFNSGDQSATCHEIRTALDRCLTHEAWSS